MKKKSAMIVIVLFTICINAQNDAGYLLQQLKTTSKPGDKFYALQNLSTFYYKAGNSDSMLGFAQEMLKTAQTLKNDSFLIASFKSLGNCSRLKSDYITAIEYYFKGVQSAENKPDISGLLAILYNNVGDNYNKLGYHDEALNYLKRAERVILKDKNKTKKNSVYVYTNLAETFLWMQKPDSALSYLQFADEENVIAKDYYIQSAIYLVFGMTHEKLKHNPEIAEKYFKRAIAFSDSMQDFKHLANSANEYSSFLLRQGKEDSAKYYALFSLRISEKYNYKDNIIANSDLLSRIFDKRQQPDSAFFFARMKNDYTDTVFKNQKQNQLLSMTFNEQIREKEEEEKRVQAAKKRADTIQYYSIATGLVIFVVLFLLLNQRIVVNSKVIVFLGSVSLLVFFEFINLLMGPYIDQITQNSPYAILFVSVGIAAFLIPLNQYLEEYVKIRLVEVNRKIKKTSAEKG